MSNSSGERINAIVFLRTEIRGQPVEVRARVPCMSFDPRLAQENPATRQVSERSKHDPIELSTMFDCAKFYACAGGRLETPRVIALYQRFIQILCTSGDSRVQLRPITADVSSTELDYQKLVGLARMFGLSYPDFSEQRPPSAHGMNFTLKLAGLAHGLCQPDRSFVTHVSKPMICSTKTLTPHENDCFISASSETPNSIWVMCVLSRSDAKRVERGEDLPLYLYTQEAHLQSSIGLVAPRSFVEVAARRPVPGSKSRLRVRSLLPHGRRVCVLGAVLPASMSRLHGNAKSRVIAVSIGTSGADDVDTLTPSFYNPMRSQYYVVEDAGINTKKTNPASLPKEDRVATQGVPGAVPTKPRELTTPELHIEGNSFEDLSKYLCSQTDAASVARCHPWTKQPYVRTAVKRRRYSMVRVLCEMSHNVAGVLPYVYEAARALNDPVALNIAEGYLPLLTSTMHRLSITGQKEGMQRYLDKLTEALNDDTRVRDIVNVPNVFGLTCMHYCIPLNLTITAALLGVYGAEDNRTDWNGREARSYASTSPMIMLVNHHAVWRKDNPGKIPFTEAKLKYERKVAELKASGQTTKAESEVQVGSKRRTVPMTVESDEGSNAQRCRVR